MKHVAVIDDRGRSVTKWIADNESAEEKSVAGTTVEPFSIFPGSPLSAWLDQLKREGFAPSISHQFKDERSQSYYWVSCRKQRQGLPGPIPRGVSVTMR